MTPLALLTLGFVLGTTVACDRPPVDATQGNFRGLGIEQIENPRVATLVVEQNQAPEPLPPVDPGGSPASVVYQNVQVLGDVDAAQFARLMGAITSWVAPNEGCGYCHDGGNFASQNVPYTHKVARRMIQMTRDINTNWKDHVGDVGVTCYTCHRGQVIPTEVWSTDPGPPRVAGAAGQKAGQNSPTGPGLTSLPYDPFTKYIAQDGRARVQSTSALPTDNQRTIKDTEWTYAFMVHISESLGVNCTHCHNSRAFGSWDESAPPRFNAWYAIEMVRYINQDYMEPLADVFPANRKGPMGDVLKVNCATCHRAQPKPLNGVSMLADYPELEGPVAR